MGKFMHIHVIWYIYILVWSQLMNNDIIILWVLGQYKYPPYPPFFFLSSSLLNLPPKLYLFPIEYWTQVLVLSKALWRKHIPSRCFFRSIGQTLGLTFLPLETHSLKKGQFLWFFLLYNSFCALPVPWIWYPFQIIFFDQGKPKSN